MDPAEIPPDVLAFFVKLKELVDATVDQLQQPASGPRVIETTITDAMAITDTISASVQFPRVAVTTADSLAPVITIATGEIETARTWLVAAVGGALVDVATEGTLNGLIELATRLIEQAT